MQNQEPAPLVDASDSEWVLADSGSVIVTAGANEQINVEVALAFPGLPMVPSEIDAVVSVLAPTAQSVERAPLRLVAVIDRSASMEGEKMRLMIETLKFMLQHLAERDALGVVAFDTDAAVLAPLTRCNAEGRAHLEAIIDRIKAGSQTNLSAGLWRGLELHGETVRDQGALSVAMQRVSFGNTYERLSEVADGEQRVHKWTVELRTEDSSDAAFIKKVVYNLHESFETPIVEVTEPPFHLTRVGWGFFKVRADVHLHDGRVLKLKHELCFTAPERFETVLLPLRGASQIVAVEADLEDNDAMVRSTFVFTDGAANRGVTTSDQICTNVASLCDGLGHKRCTISTFGFGASHQEELLRNIASTGQGVYCFIENAESIGEAFGEALGGLLSVTHQNVRLCLELAPDVKLTKARTKYAIEGPTLNENGFQSVTIEIGDLFAEERRDILVELSLPAVEIEGPQTFGRVFARALSVLSSRLETTPFCDLALSRQSTGHADRGLAHPQVERHRNRHVASEALAASRVAARRGQLEEARTILQAASTDLLASPLATEGCQMTQALLEDLRECSADLQNQQTYTCSGSKKMAQLQMAHERQRTCGGKSSDYYGNSLGFTMKSLGKTVV